MRDLIVIGKGPAGISGAIYAKRAKLDVLVIGKDMGTLEKAHMIENYYGFEEAISGEELFKQGIQQAEKLGIDIITDEVLAVNKNEHFTVVTKDGNYESRAVLIAAGSNRIKANITGLKQLEGKGVSYCAVCDAYFYQGKDVAVLGNGEYAAHEIVDLLPHVKHILLLTNGEKLAVTLPDTVNVMTEKVKHIHGDEKITHIEFVDGSVVNVEGLFVALGSAGSAELAYKLGVVTDSNKIITDENMRTNVEGLYAAGDSTTGIQQIAKAVADGCIAATDIIKYLRSKKA